MAAKKSLLTDKRTLATLLFSLICFCLVLADVATRLNGTTATESGHMETISIPLENGTNTGEPEKELTPQELDRLIEETMNGDAGSV